MRVIYKYPLNFTPGQKHTAIRLPTDNKVVGVGKDAADQLCVWIEHPYGPLDVVHDKTEQFQIVGTGHQFEDDCWHHVGIIMDMPYVWHVLQFGRKP